ncbi:hypothetical protein [Flavobacteriaceae bacterium 14752]|uniref:hypothetical protein n=1 Tax=Mesohalobacter salilacus TaxID=2491711 RepID=UPI000F6367FA|nr:hypothetical protein EIG84_07320 [Flavobacteriaceae bacterium 14752]
MNFFKLFLAVVFLGLISSNAFSQNATLKAIDSFALKADKFVGIDKFQNLFYIKNNTLFKKPENQDAIAFQDFQLGEIERVDILNPNKISVFYQDSNVVVILDNRMAEIDRQDYNSVFPFKNVAFAGTSKDQSLWIYNIDLNQLELYDYRFDKTLAKSLPINDEILGMTNNFNQCFLLTKDGVLVYNIYGSLVKNIQRENIKAFDLFKNQLLLYDDEDIIVLDKNFETKYTINTISLKKKNLFFTDENLYIYDGKKVIQHTILSK